MNAKKMSNKFSISRAYAHLRARPPKPHGRLKGIKSPLGRFLAVLRAGFWLEAVEPEVRGKSRLEVGSWLGYGESFGTGLDL
jgi:hypothetical protein